MFNSDRMARSRLISAAQSELNGIEPQVVDQIWDWLNVVFKKWKLELGDRQPTRRVGLLGPDEPLPFEEAQPWECADFILPGRILLFYKLWSESYPDANTIISKVGIRVLIAVLIIKGEHESFDDLFSAHELLSNHRDLDRLEQVRVLLPLAEKGAAHSKTQSVRASMDRKQKPSFQDLLRFQDQYLAKYGHTRGWKKAACSEFNLSDKTLNNILKNMPE